MADAAMSEATLAVLERLERRQTRLSVVFTLVTLALTLGYVIAMGMRLPLLAAPVSAGATLTWGFIVGQGLLILSFLLTGAYALLVRRYIQPLQAALHAESDAR